MSLIPDNAAEVTVTIDGPSGFDPGLCVFGVLNVPEDDAETILALAVPAWGAAFLPVMNSTYKLVKGRVLMPDQTQAESTLNLPGAIVDPPAPPNCAFLCRKRSLVTGRRNQGRMYIPGVSVQDYNDEGGLNIDTFNALDAGADSLFDELEAGDHPMVILHSTPPEISTLVSSFQADPRLATQRRRMR